MRKRRRFSSLFNAAIIVAVAALMGTSGFGSAALAQTSGTAGPISLGDLFGPESVDLKAGANAVLNAAIVNASMSQCRTQKTNIKVVVAEGDLLFQEALGRARADAIDAALKGQGVLAERYAVDYGGFGDKDDIQVEYGDIIPDRDKPKLDTNSDPRKGTKVKAGDQIVVTMVATDRANQWQTGIKSIQLQDISTNPNGVLVPSPMDYGRLPDPCNAATMQRTHIVTYTVPPSPPPIVRLRAITEDFAGNIDTDTAEFPTGDWYGTITWRETLLNVASRIPTRYWGRLDFTADYDGLGNLTGRLVGIEDFGGSADGGPPCEFKTTKPTHLEVSLTGSFTPGTNTMSLFVDPKTMKYAFGELGYTCDSPSHVIGRLDPVIRPELDEIMQNISIINGDRAVVVRDWNPSVNGTGALHMELEFHRAQN